MAKVLCLIFSLLFAAAAQAQNVIPLKEIGGLHSAYVVPRDDFNRVDVQLIVLSGAYDDPDPSGTAHFLEHLVAFSADATVLRQPRERDLFAKTTVVSTIYTNSGAPQEMDRLMKLSRAVLDTPSLPQDFAQSEIKIVQREIQLRERENPNRWLKRLALQNLYGSKKGRADDVVADLPKLNMQTALDFHKAHYVPSNIMLLISGKITKEDAAQMVKTYFGDTAPSIPPAKHYLEQKPSPKLRAFRELSSERLAADVMVYARFIPFNVESSFDMQGTFFIAASIYQSRINKAFMYDSLDYLSFSSNSYFAKNGDLEVTAFIVPMPHVDLETARAKFETTIETLLQTPVSAEEIETARRKQAINAKNAARRPSTFLRFLENVASDGLPPVSPGVFAKLIEQTRDEQVLSFLQAYTRPAAASILFAREAD